MSPCCERGSVLLCPHTVVQGSGQRMPELYAYEVIVCFASAIGGAWLMCLLPDGLDSRDGEIRSIQLN